MKLSLHTYGEHRFEINVETDPYAVGKFFVEPRPYFITHQYYDTYAAAVSETERQIREWEQQVPDTFDGWIELLLGVTDRYGHDLDSDKEALRVIMNRYAKWKYRNESYP